MSSFTAVRVLSWLQQQCILYCQTRTLVFHGSVQTTIPGQVKICIVNQQLSVSYHGYNSNVYYILKPEPLCFTQVCKLLFWDRLKSVLWISSCPCLIMVTTAMYIILSRLVGSVLRLLQLLILKMSTTDAGETSGIFNLRTWPTTLEAMI